MTIYKYAVVVDDEIVCYFESEKVFWTSSKIKLTAGNDETHNPNYGHHYTICSPSLRQVKNIGGNKNEKI